MVTVIDFSIGEKEFKAGKINAMKQFHVVRRIAPILGDLIPVLKKFEGMSEEELKKDQIESLAPILNGLAKLSDKDSEFVLYSLLAAVEMKQDLGNWAKLSNGEQLMFNDLELPVLLQVAGRTFMHNLTGFFAVLPKLSK